MDSVGALAPKKGGGRGNQTLPHLIQSLSQFQVYPTHFLLVQFCYRSGLNRSTMSEVRRLFFELLNGRLYTHTIMGDDDPLKLTWKSANTSTSMLYYTISRNEETYVHQMAKGLIKSIYNKILDDLDLDNADLQLNYLTTKNINFTINLTTGAQESFGQVNEMPVTPAIIWENGNRELVAPGQVDEEKSEASNENERDECLEFIDDEDDEVDMRLLLTSCSAVILNFVITRNPRSRRRS